MMQYVAVFCLTCVMLAAAPFNISAAFSSCQYLSVLSFLMREYTPEFASSAV
ncbi:hypothetical protein TELCIR_10384 [Teladorsagia circumcincta]|uniref:Uncharacterized protein n=1 Tax=Teladorsagia circumcincta TaxID=45464 RepID=A0A2G9UC91_TELCI|nr:hypothetical protein TELCIR_10384 [Teladorsagia circumcincta]